MVKAGMIALIAVLTVGGCGRSVLAGSSKKGWAESGYNYNCHDMDVVHNVAWWYDWSQTPWHHHSANCTNTINDRNRVPMVWGWRHGTDYPLYFHNNTSPYVLGFNEPNHSGQANLTPQEAAAAWREVQARADQQDQKLVSPSAIHCSQSSTKCFMDGVQWFTEFFAACRGCRVDYLSTHMYTCDVNHVMDFLEQLHTRFGKDVWLTEVACPTHSYTHALAFMQDLLPRLEAAPHVFRYAWYASRVRGVGSATHEDSLMHTDSTDFSTLGQYYNNFM